MAQTLYRLSAKTVASIKEPGRHADGGNLYLSVSRSGSKSWSFFYKTGGRMREMGLGSFTAISLAEAREKAQAARRDLANGIDPLERKKSERLKPASKTFGEVAEDYIEAHKSDWKNDKHQEQWRSSLKQHAASLWKLPVNEIDTAQVVAALDPIWLSISETARRVRGRIETVLDSAKAKGLRSGENPARWRGHLDMILAKKRKKAGNFASMDYHEIPAFMAELHRQEGIGARALEFLILNANRTQEVASAPWAEFSQTEPTWTIAGARMKMSKDYTVPYARRSREILDEMHGLDSTFVFPGTKRGKDGSSTPISTGTMSAVLKRMGIENATVHGFRASFRTWAANETNHPRDVCEAALAHTISDKVEAAYNRADLLRKRAALLQDWADYCKSTPLERENIIPFGRRSA